MKKCLKIKILGNVQNVGYRKFVQEQARKFSVEGTVQNVNDGSVLIHACGTAATLDDFIDLLCVGSNRAKVESVTTESLGTEKDFRGVFRIIGVD